MSDRPAHTEFRLTPLRVAVFALAALAVAWPAAEPDARTRLSGSEWQLVELEGRNATGLGTLRFTNTSVRGKAACNRFFGSFRETIGQISIAGLNSTRMHCQGRMELEQAFLSALARVTAYRIDNGRLVLLANDGKALLKLSA